MIFAPDGPNAGKILAVIDWEMTMTVPLWELVCYPLWFGRVGFFKTRDPVETQLFKDTYIRELQRELQRYSRDGESHILRVIQNSRSEGKKRFADSAILPWDTADRMEAWMQQNSRRV